MSFNTIGIEGAGISAASPLGKVLMSDAIQPGSELGYQLAKTIYLYHPMGMKMAEAPINMAQSQPRTISVQEAPDEVREAFEAEWKAIQADANVHNVARLSRVYGIASIVCGSEEVPADQPLDMAKIHSQKLFFNVLDPLNTAGSLVLSQIPTSPDFLKPMTVRTGGTTFHHSRYQVVMNEEPVFISFTTSAFGFVGRSVYQRALYPLKSFIRSMIADDMIATKLGLIVAKQRAPGSIINQAMQAIAGVKRALLKEAQTGNVLSIETDEEIETLNMMNVDGAGAYSRTNIIKNIATAADMPAKMLDNETMVAGFGEGTEDAKNIARYIDRIRIWMDPIYRWFTNIVQYRAWNPEFYKIIQEKYPDQWGAVSYEDAFSRWRQNFAAEWPSLLTEPESEQIKVAAVKLESLVAIVEVLIPQCDPENLATVIDFLCLNVSADKRLFQHGLVLDLDTLKEFVEEKNAQQQEMQQAAQQEPDGMANKFGKFAGADSAGPRLRRLRDAVEKLPVRAIK